MNTRSVKSSHVSAFGIGVAGIDGAGEAPPSAIRHGPTAPTCNQPDAKPGPPFKTNVTLREAELASSN